MRAQGTKKGVRWAALLATACLPLACGTAVQRDLHDTRPQQVVLEDMCGVQAYHDTLATNQAKGPAVVATNELEKTEGKHVSGGRTRFAFETPFQLENLRQVLLRNWKRVPDPVLHAPRVELEVRWSLKAGVKRVVTEEDAELGVKRETWALPYHICLSELLFGDSLYRTRRDLLGNRLADTRTP